MKNIPKGYKQTELGILPKEWEVVRLSEICEIKTGATPQRTIQKYWENPQINWVKTGDLNNSFILATDEKISFVALEETSCKLLPKHTVLIAMYGGFNQIGRTGILAIEAATNQAISALIAKKLSILNHIFLNNYLIFYRKRWKKVAISSRKDPNITKTDIENFKIPLPPLKEQEKIAEILSTADTQIQNLEKLISLKERYKKGLMQKLFSQKIRFKGFNDEWEVVELSKVGNIVTGSTPSTKNKQYYENGTYPWITPTDITDSPKISSSKVCLTQKGIEKSRFIPKNSLLVTCIASIGKNAILEVDGSCNQQINAIVPHKTHSVVFLYYFLTNKSHILKKFAGQGGMQILTKNLFGSLKFIMPNNLQEQQKIAEVLSACDDEVQNLKAKLELLKKQKQALIQKLLNGKVRVKI